MKSHSAIGAAVVFGPFALCLALTAPAHADVELLKGGTTSASLVDNTSVAYLNGATFVAGQTVPDAGGNLNIGGNLSVVVIRESASNGGRLDFLYQFQAAGNNSGGLNAITVADYTQFATRVAALASAPGIAGIAQYFKPVNISVGQPMKATRSSGTGDMITFDFTGQSIFNSSNSYIFLVRTDAQQYNASGAGLGSSQTPGLGSDAWVKLYEPTVVPEPGPLVLVVVAGGLALAALRGRRPRG